MTLKPEAKHFLELLKDNAKYWSEIAEKENYSYEELSNSLTFSILSLIDGCSSENTIFLYNTDDRGNLTECINRLVLLHEWWYEIK